MNADRVHKAVWRAIQAVLTADVSILQSLWEACASEHEAVQQELKEIQREIDRLLDLHTSGVEIPDIADRLRYLHAHRQELARVQIVNFEQAEQLWKDFQHAHADLEKAWEVMTHDERRTAPMAVERVEVVGDYVRVYIPLPRGLESNSSMVERRGLEPPTSRVRF